MAKRELNIIPRKDETIRITQWSKGFGENTIIVNKKEASIIIKKLRILI